MHACPARQASPPHRRPSPTPALSQPTLQSILPAARRFTALVVCLLASQTHAQDAVLQGNLSLQRLVDLAALQLNIRVEYDPALLNGHITLRDAHGLSPLELWDFTNAALAARGYTTIRQPSHPALSVVKLTDAAALARTELHHLTTNPLAPEPLTEPFAAPYARTLTPDAVPAGFVNQLVRVHSRPAADVASDLRPLLSKQGASVSAVGHSGLVLISDTSARVQQALQFLAALDRAHAALDVEHIPVANLPADRLAALATQIASKRKTIDGLATPGDLLLSPAGNALLLIAPDSARPAWRELIAHLDQREAILTATYTPQTPQLAQLADVIEQSVADASDERFRIVQDELTSALIITATPRQHALIDAILARVNAQTRHQPKALRAFPVRNRPVADLLSVLNELLSSSALFAPSDAASADASPSDPALASDPPDFAVPVRSTSSQLALPPSPLGPAAPAAHPVAPTLHAPAPLALTADPATNTIIAVGAPALLTQLEALLPLLDVRQPQVMLEVTLLSLSDNDALSLGLELEKLDMLGDASLKLSSLFGLSTPANAGRAVGDARGFSGVLLSPGEFSIVARALQTLSQGRSTSIPKVLVSNNQQATFASVLQQPFQTAIGSSGGTAQGFGGFQDAGTTISVRPQIAQGDELVLEYSLSLSSFVGGSAAPGLPPPRQQNRVDSLATLPDGYTVVVGGLDFSSSSRSQQRVPGLGALPLIGELFRSRDVSEGRQRFFVFIRATVLRDARLADLQYLSHADAAAASLPADDPPLAPRIIRTPAP